MGGRGTKVQHFDDEGLDHMLVGLVMLKKSQSGLTECTLLTVFQGLAVSGSRHQAAHSDERRLARG